MAGAPPPRLAHGDFFAGLEAFSGFHVLALAALLPALLAWPFAAVGLARSTLRFRVSSFASRTCALPRRAVWMVALPPPRLWRGVLATLTLFFLPCATATAALPRAMLREREPRVLRATFRRGWTGST